MLWQVVVKTTAQMGNRCFSSFGNKNDSNTIMPLVTKNLNSKPPRCGYLPAPCNAGPSGESIVCIEADDEVMATGRDTDDGL